MEQPITSITPRRRPGPRITAGFGYAIILTILFHRLLAGSVLSPGAIIGAMETFYTKQYDVDVNLNVLEFDVWTLITPWQFEQYQHKGGIPMWNPHIYGGFPVYGNGQSELLNPTHWIYYFVNPDLARGPMAALRLWVSAMLMFILLRRFGIGPMASFLGGAIWILSAFNIRWLLWPLTDCSLVLPLLVLTLDSFLIHPTGRRWALVALACLIPDLSGHPGTQLMVGIIVGIFVLARAAALWAEGCTWSALVPRVLGCAAAWVGGLMAAMAAILPLIGQIRGSFELTQGNRGAWVLPFQTFWLFITPNIYGWPRGSHRYRGPLEYNDVSCWFGLVALALALAAAVMWGKGFRIWGKKPRNPRDLHRQPTQHETGRAEVSSDIFQIRNSSPPRWVGGFAIFLVAVSLPLAFGATQYFELIRRSPLGTLISFNRMFLGIHFGGSILAAMGVDQVMGAGTRRTTRLAFFLMLIATAFGACLLVYYGQIQYLRMAAHLPWTMFWLDSSVRVLGGLLIGMLACILLGVIAWTSRSGLPVAAPLRNALAFVIVADMLWVAWDFNPIPPRELVQPPLPPAIRNILASADDGRIGATDYLLAPNLATIYGFRDVRGFDLPKPYRLGRLLNKLDLDQNPWSLLPKERMAPVMDPILATWLDRCSVRYLVTPVQTDVLRIGRHSTDPASPSIDPSRASLEARAEPSMASSDRPWPLAEQLPKCCVYANPNAYPRAFIPAEASPGGEAQALQTLLDPATDLRQKTIYESTQPAMTAPFPTNASGMVKITTDQDEEVILDVQTPTGGLVVLGDNMDAGWTVTVDGVPSMPLIANYLFRGVQVAPGRHIVRWSYRTPFLLMGSIISLLTLIVLLWLVMKDGWNRPTDIAANHGGRPSALGNSTL